MASTEHIIGWIFFVIGLILLVVLTLRQLGCSNQFSPPLCGFFDITYVEVITEIFIVLLFFGGGLLIAQRSEPQRPKSIPISNYGGGGSGNFSDTLNTTAQNVGNAQVLYQAGNDLGKSAGFFKNAEALAPEAEEAAEFLPFLA